MASGEAGSSSSRSPASRSSRSWAAVGGYHSGWRAVLHGSRSAATCCNWCWISAQDWPGRSRA